MRGGGREAGTPAGLADREPQNREVAEVRRAGSWLAATRAVVRPVLLLALVGAASASAATAAGATSEPSATYAGVPVVGRPCEQGEGVTVIVDFTTLGGGVRVGCAAGDQAHGFAALRAAGFRTSSEGGVGRICTLDGLPTQGYPYCWTTGGFWSHWAEGSSDDWEFHQVGAGHGPLAPGHVSGWSWAQDFRSAPPRIPPRWSPPTVAEPDPVPVMPDGGGPVEIDPVSPGGGVDPEGEPPSDGGPYGPGGGPLDATGSPSGTGDAGNASAPAAEGDADVSGPPPSGEGPSGQMELTSAPGAPAAAGGGSVAGVGLGVGLAAVVGAAAAIAARRRRAAADPSRTGVHSSSIR